MEVQIKDSRKRTRTLEINGFIKPSGMRVAKIRNDQNKEYFTQARPNGTGKCSCDSHYTCYHIKALLQADIPTFEEIVAQSPEEIAAEAEAVNMAKLQALRERDAINPYEILAPTKHQHCPGCGGSYNDKAKNCSVGRCYWNSWYNTAA